MIFKVKEIVALRDFSERVHELHIEKPVEETIDITLGRINELWGTSEGTIIVEDNLIEDYFDKNGYFNLQYTTQVGTALYFEIEEGYYLENLDQLDRNIRVIILITDFINSKTNRIIYSFFLMPGQVLNLNGKKVKSRRIQNYIQSQSDDLELRVMLLNQSNANWRDEYKPEDILTAQEFADYLKMPIGTFHNKLSKGEILGPRKIGGSNRWVFKEIQDWLNILSKA